MRTSLLLALVALAVACAPRRVNEAPIIEQGDRVAPADEAVAATRADQEARRAEAMDRRDELAAAALANCTPTICAAIGRGDVVLGMREDEVLAATRTTEAAWSVRRSGPATVLVANWGLDSPRDVYGQLAMVQLRDGRVSSYSYREPQGVRLVSSSADETPAGRGHALAEMLVREGDDLVAQGDLDAALDRYDRADVLSRGDPELDYRIASVLDKQLRPIEALMRYQLFLHRLEIERIGAIGDAHGKMADAIARARERIIILERQSP